MNKVDVKIPEFKIAKSKKPLKTKKVLEKHLIKKTRAYVFLWSKPTRLYSIDCAPLNLDNTAYKVLSEAEPDIDNVPAQFRQEITRLRRKNIAEMLIKSSDLPRVTLWWVG